MTQIKTLLPFIFLFSGWIYGQTCTCESDFEWVKKMFEKNDAGFQYALDIKGKEAYENHNKLFYQRLSQLTDQEKCPQLLYEWLLFFRSGHVAIVRKEQAVSKSPAVINNEKWQTLRVNPSEFKKYLAGKQEIDFEGTWYTDPYTIGIKREGDEYLGFIMESKVESWKKGEVKLRIPARDSGMKPVFYMRDRSAQEFDTAQLLGSNYLEIGSFVLERLDSPYPRDKQIDDFIRSTLASRPYLEELNSTTLVLRVPSFGDYAKNDIDSVIEINRNKLLQTKNLIIDLRNNGGGSDMSFQEILPLLYTNPIRTLGVAFLSTTDNNQRMLDFITDPKYGFSEEDKKWAQESYDKLTQHPGEFVNLQKESVSIETFDTVYPYPSAIGIIINEANGSTAEQFLLAAKQSRKVKLFGTTTFGSLDISNMYFVDSPCKDFQLGYCLSKSLRIPEMTIDGKGIQPDYHLDKTIPPYQWVEFVNKVLTAE
ncbi:MAG: S41 family peptidase [Bacteroidota bacterium]